MRWRKARSKGRRGGAERTAVSVVRCVLAGTEGDKSICGTEQEQMKKWHGGASGQQRQRGFCSLNLQLRRGHVFLCTPWILTPTQVCLFTQQ